jgi:Protein of unknown function, DUF400.
LIFVFVAVVLQVAPCPAASSGAEEGVTIEVEGISPVLNDDKIQAEQMAVTDALRNAVEKVAGALIDVQTDTKNYQLIQDTIKLRSSAYVAGQEILKRWTEDGYYKVLVRVTVKQDALKQSVDALKLTLIRAGKPRLIILVPDLNSATRITQNLKDAGFPVVDPARLEADVFAEDEKSLFKLAVSYQAEILIIGNLRKEFIGETDGIYAERAYLSLRAIRPDSGQTLVAQTFDARGVDISESRAFQKALAGTCDQAVDFLKDQLGKQLVDSERTVQITVSGIDYSELQQLQRYLRATPNVANVFLRSFDNGSAQLDVETGLLPDQLADFISAWKSLYLEITGISGSRINLHHRAL